jgi:Membrane proteins related to metalloendopeptidases
LDGKYLKIKDTVIEKILNAVAYVIAFFINVSKLLKRFFERLNLTDYKALVLEMVTYISVFIVAFICLIYVKQMISCDIQMMVYVNGVELGLVENTFVIDGSVRKIEREVNQYADEKYSCDYDIEYKFVNSKETTYLTGDDCHKFLNNICPLGIVDMYSVYIDGTYIGSLKEQSNAVKLIEEYKNNTLTELQVVDSKIVDIKLYSDIRIDFEQRIKIDLSEYDEIYEKFSGDKSISAASVTLFSENVKSEETKISETSLIKYAAIKHEIFTEVIKCEVEYRDSDKLYIGLEEQATEGSDGIYQLIYEYEYIDGDFYSEKLISEKFLIDPEPIIILKGAKQPPPSVSTGEFLYPLDISNGMPVISSYFAEQREEFDGDEYHYGIDIVVAENEYIYASDGGYVDYSNESPSYGNMVRVLHKNGMSTYYAHMVERLVEAGENVYPGQIIGKVGMTGVATAPHLHFEIREGMMPVDPLKYLP